MDSQYITLIPHKDIWPFVSRMFIGGGRAGGKWIDPKNTPPCSHWCIEVESDDLLYIYVIGYRSDRGTTHNMMMFYVERLVTRGGVLIVGPSDIIEFFEH